MSMQESHAANMTNNLKGNQEQIPVSSLLSFSLDIFFFYPRVILEDDGWHEYRTYIYIYCIYIP